MAEALGCGCRIFFSHDEDRFGITYCPMHKAAPAMLEALERVRLGGAHEGSCDNIGLEREEACTLHTRASGERLKLVRTAIAQARDQEVEA